MARLGEPFIQSWLLSHTMDQSFDKTYHKKWHGREKRRVLSVENIEIFMTHEVQDD
jgi:hypothetical protein